MGSLANNSSVSALLTLDMLDIFMYSFILAAFQLWIMHFQSNIVDPPDQMVCQKPADQDLQCFQQDKS